MLISNMKTYENIKLMGKGKYILKFSNVVLCIIAYNSCIKVKNKSFKNNYSYSNLQMDTQYKKMWIMTSNCNVWGGVKVQRFFVHDWRRLLRVLWTARRSNQSILKDISPGISLEGMMLKLTLQYFGHLMHRVDSLGKTLMLGGIGGRRRRGRQRMRWLDGITDSMDVGLAWNMSKSATRTTK